MSVPVLKRAGDLLARYDVLISDVWGVVHDGLWALEPACEALMAYRERGGTVVLLSNAPGPSQQVAGLLDAKRVPREAWDRLVTSGDVTRALIAQSHHKRAYHIGWQSDRAVFDGLDVELVGEDKADIVVATELNDYRTETPEQYRPLLERFARRGLPFICGNPDLVVHVGEDLLPCAGALATIYEELGGSVAWAGKPYRPAYDLALAAAADARGGRSVEPSKVLVIGDAVRTDLAGARLMGFDSLFIAGGIHRDETMRGGEVDAAGLARVLDELPVQPIAAMGALA
ncbi:MULTISPECIES: TIGR01459 family HAD-type hydrolase [Bosea]|jgi:HAD superfamily hydrolase (TIGR01459 family)|uniref:TIGR01459 family HAD-type hydrolase n=1 Tax=Bosea TaxID=85413 RepID=UPI00214FD56D|nr:MULTISPECIES: TIGR01459 family HAD-type hydrolase [Bosea]MCR4520082.1 TIGR01459 family HAD-type hydrolase [Bosea sp. 47.2.35]MDR6829647.1 HAD superfamily hydrolase (TIGR01459 family) [Bosea robiniae]MDR6896530.1 HAD superfamily hydrolase (TIGR01459 family) [Bosea sp. BE109]MDR7139928.1 HAD superfamily hydrolase (TIGR01459 family) [Bosea sp. BE168]MDR7176758.1 HAD superfamily hydrolase (TIGR01459 family) [Bosea sp. BE271]